MLLKSFKICLLEKMYFKEWDKLHVHVYKKGSENELQIRVCSLARKLNFVFMNKILKHPKSWNIYNAD